MVFPLPELKDVFEGTVVEDNDLNKQIIDNNVKENMTKLEEYQKQVQSAYFDLWKLTADGFLHLKNLINFFL